MFNLQFPPRRFKFLIYCSLVFGFSFLIISCEKENSITEIEDNSPADVETRSSETVIDILASGTSIGKSINVQVQLSDGSFTQDWSNEISSLGAPILAIIEEPILHPVIPDGTCCQIDLLPPYSQSSQLFVFVGERGIDSSDGYAAQFIDWDVDKVEPEQITPFYDGRRRSNASFGNISCDIPDSGIGLWWPTIAPGRYDVHVSKGWILNNGTEGICDTDSDTYRINN